MNLGIILNGVTGRMGTNQHLVRSILAIREQGGIPLEFPVHPIQETGKRPTAGIDRNLAYLSLVEVLYGYPIDGVVLTIGCDKTTPAMLMGAATVNIPAIALSVGPMLNGWFRGERTGSGTIVWRARELLATGEIGYREFIDLVASSTPSTGYCNTMGTATTMNSLAEALGMMLPGTATIPAPYRDRQEAAYLTGKRIVEMVDEDLKPSDIMTRESFLNAIAVNSAIGGSTNAPIHLIAIAPSLLENDVILLLESDLPLTPELSGSIQHLAQQTPVLLGFGFGADTIDAVLEKTQVKGISLQGSDEIKPGLKDFDELADILEVLEEHIKQLQGIHRALDTEDFDALYKLVKQSNKIRRIIK